MQYTPSIIRFLGYNPLLRANGWAERFVQGRTALGLSQKEAARELRVDPSTLARWQRGERVPAGAFATRVLRFLNAEDVTGLRVQDARLNKTSKPAVYPTTSEKQSLIL